MANNRTKAFGKAQPAQAPTFREPEVEFDDNEDDTAYRRTPVQVQGSGTLILSIVCMICVLCFSGLGIFYFVNSPTQVQAMQLPKHEVKIDGSKAFARKHQDCIKRAQRGIDKKSRELLDAVEQVSIGLGRPSIDGNPKLILCVSETPRKYLCDRKFRSGFNSLVSEFQSSYLATSQSARDMSSMFSMFDDPDGEPRINYREKAQSKINALFQSGHLRRNEFKSFLLGEPEWLKQIFANGGQPPAPC